MIHLVWGRRGQSRASSAPIWRLGVQCERPIRDLARLTAPALVNLAARPGCLGMEAGAPKSPTADESIHAAAAGRRTEGVNPLAPGSQCLDGGPLFGVCPPSFFCYPLTTATGRSRATLLPIPAECTTSTTLATSL